MFKLWLDLLPELVENTSDFFLYSFYFLQACLFKKILQDASFADAIRNVYSAGETSD